MANQSETGRPPRVLVVDDIPSVIRLLQLELRSQGWDVVTAQVGEQTFRALEEHAPDVVLLEVVLPGFNGFELIREIKERYDVPVVFVTSQGTDADRAYGLELGAADYITKPFKPSELSVRLRSVLGEGPLSGPRILRAGDVDLDFGMSIARRAGEPIALGTNEWSILLALADAESPPLPARELLIGVWGTDYVDERRYLEVWIARLRRKIEADPDKPEIVVGDWDAGYTLRASPNER